MPFGHGTLTGTCSSSTGQCLKTLPHSAAWLLLLPERKGRLGAGWEWGWRAGVLFVTSWIGVVVCRRGDWCDQVIKEVLEYTHRAPGATDGKF